MARFPVLGKLDPFTHQHSSLTIRLRQFIGITASDFFCPNLSTIAKIFGLSDNIAGVTFLAFGNGSPDLFATYSAMRTNSGSLAVGELLGAASFIISVVVGSMCIIKPFHVRRGAFLRDIGFFTTAVALLLFILIDGKIYVWEAASLVGLYLTYVTAVVIGTWWSNRREKQQERELLMRAEYAVEETAPDFTTRGYFDADEEGSLIEIFLQNVCYSRICIRSSRPTEFSESR